MLDDFLGGFWAPTLLALIFWLVFQVATHVRQEERKRRAFFDEPPLS